MTFDVTDRSTWKFSPTEDEIARVRDAHVSYTITHGGAPDMAALRVLLMGGFGGDVDGMLRFWNVTLMADAPVEAVELAPLVRSQFADLWRESKIASIVASLDLAPVVEWEHRSTSGSLKSPEHLRRAASDLDDAIEAGFSLVSVEKDDEDLVVTWHLRRRKGEKS